MKLALIVLLILAPFIIGGTWQHFNNDVEIAPYKPDGTAAARDIGPVDIRGTIHNGTNAARAEHGLPALHRDHRLDAIAQAHADDMIARDYYDHDTPDGIDPTGRAEQVGYNCRKDLGGGRYTVGIGENIAAWLGRHSAGFIAADAVPGWMNSPGHRDNILGANYDRLGVGVATSDSGRTTYAVQNFC